MDTRGRCDQKYLPDIFDRNHMICRCRNGLAIIELSVHDGSQLVYGCRFRRVRRTFDKTENEMLYRFRTDQIEVRNFLQKTWEQYQLILSSIRVTYFRLRGCLPFGLDVFFECTADTCRSSSPQWEMLYTCSNTSHLAVEKARRLILAQRTSEHSLWQPRITG